jgi:glycosyltransferase involved in cell wall biosynthesis
MIKCSVVIPVHNEATDIKSFILQFWNSLGQLQGNITEILLMENGSTDNSYLECRDLGKELPVVKVHHLPFPSYGEAIKQGMLKASGDVVSILECDALNAGFLSDSLIAIEQENADLVVASKRHPQSIDRRPIKRRMLTFFFNLYLKYFFNFPGTDTHGLKTIRKNIAQSLCDLSITGGEILQTEIVLLAHRMGYKVIERPLSIEEKRGTQVSIVKRFPKVINIIMELKKSLKRFPERTGE